MLLVHPTQGRLFSYWPPVCGPIKDKHLTACGLGHASFAIRLAEQTHYLKFPFHCAITKAIRHLEEEWRGMFRMFRRPPNHLQWRLTIWESQDITGGRIADKVPAVVGAPDEDKTTARLGERHDYPVRKIVRHELLDRTTGLPRPRVEMGIVAGPYRCEEQPGAVRPVGAPQVEVGEVVGRERGAPRAGGASEVPDRLGRQPGEDLCKELLRQRRSFSLVAAVLRAHL